METESKWEKRRKAVKNKLQEMAKTSKSKVIKKEAKERSNEDNEQVQINIELVQTITREAINMYREGEMTFQEMKNDIKVAMDAI